jgi:gas vesicle protein
MENRDHDILIRLDTMVQQQGRELREVSANMKTKADTTALEDLGRRLENMKEELKKDLRETMEDVFQPRFDNQQEQLKTHSDTLKDHGEKIRNFENARNKFMGVIIACGFVFQLILWLADKYWQK